MDRQEAIKVIKDNWPESRHQLKEALQTLIPELKESEDERIRKALKEYFINSFQNNGVAAICGVHIKDILAWLEKQGEQKSTDTCDSSTINGKEFPASEKRDFGYFSESGDKVEPKFKVGDFIVNDYCTGKVIELTNDAYLLDSGQGIPFSCEHNVHLWTIQDAKDGDVLSYNDGHGNDCLELIKSITDKKIEFWFCLTNSNRYEVFDGITPYTNIVSREDATPATKEQRDLLFKKMKEAGYEWDAKKKELKKIEQKSAWSEEDETAWNNTMIMVKGYAANHYTKNNIKLLSSVVTWLKSLKEKVQPQSKQDWSEEEKARIDKIIDVLDWAEEKGRISYSDWEDYVCYVKSLRPQSTWKPSEEQIRGIKCAIKTLQHQLNVGDKRLDSLYDDLKKLREE